MAQYKVPQDVEADDKLLGPFTFRQFVYLMIIGGLIFFGFLLWQLFPLLVLIVVPPILLLGALCFPFKKDQPMETYLSAIVAYHLKPHTRVWEPGEPDVTIIITAPKKTDEIHLKDISQEEATHRLSFLAEIVDTEGYAIKGGVKEEIYAEANTAKDMFELSETSTLNQALQANSASRHEELVNQMREAIARNNSLGGTPTISHNISNPNTQSLAQAAVAPIPAPTPITVTPIPQPTNPADVTPLSATGTVAGTNPFATQTSAVIQPDLPLPETIHTPTYNEQLANSSEYLPDDEKVRLGGTVEEQPEEVETSENIESPENTESPIEEESSSEESADTPEESQPDNPESEGGEEYAPEGGEESTTETTDDSTPAPETPQPSQQMIDLANNPDFSIETIAQQANRINNEDNKDEVYISLH